MHIIKHNNAQYYIDCNLVGKGNLKTNRPESRMYRCTALKMIILSSSNIKAFPNRKVFKLTLLVTTVSLNKESRACK